jgi:ribonuclease R
MNTDNLKQDVSALLARGMPAVMTDGEIGKELGLHGKNLKQLQKWLNEMVAAGDIVRIRQNRYALGLEADLLTGTLQVLRSGNGFVNGIGACEGKQLFVPAEAMGTAMPNDRVLVRLEQQALPEGVASRGPSGRIIRILERARRDIVGTLRSTGRFLYVVPISPMYKQDFYVPDAAGANLEDRVVIRFTKWENKHVSPEAEIVERIGPSDQPSLDTLSVVRNYNLRDEYPAEVLEEAETASLLVSNPGPRMDLRAEYILTIDPVRARDFDDALSLTTDADGHRVLGVHIADVSHFVRPGSALDREALERGNSTYLTDKVLPMLPEQLSNGVCSLNPNVDRLAFSAFLTMDDQGNVLKRKFAKTIMHSCLRLTYEQAMEAIRAVTDGGAAPAAMPAEAVALLGKLHRLAQQLRAQRFARHAMDLEVPECQVEMLPDGRMKGIVVSVSDPSHQLVEECMVAANEAVATELLGNNIPVVSRLHEAPAEEKIEELAAYLIGMGYQPGNLNQRANLAAFLKKIKDDPLAYHVRSAVLRSLKRAVYSAEAGGHFGLAKTYYAHFTSPIRRYPDLTVHRQLEAWLARSGNASRENAPRSLDKETLQRVALHCSQTEQISEEAERSLLEIKKYRYLAEQSEKQPPETYDAVVVNVMNFGLFVELIELQIQGLVHVSSLSDQFVRFNKERGRLEAGKNTFKLGDRLQVRVAKVDFDKRRVDFLIAAPPGDGGKGRAEGGRGQGAGDRRQPAGDGRRNVAGGGGRGAGGGRPQAASGRGQGGRGKVGGGRPEARGRAGAAGGSGQGSKPAKGGQGSGKRSRKIGQ